MSKHEILPFRKSTVAIVASLTILYVSISFLSVSPVQAATFSRQANTRYKSANVITHPCNHTYQGGSIGYTGFALLATNYCFVSSDSNTVLDMQQDGNLVVYARYYYNNQYIYVPLWATHTVGKGASFVVLQSDGNFVMYTPPPARKAIWATGTYGSARDLNDTIGIDDSGDVAIHEAYPNNGVILWDTGTYHS